MRHARGQPLSCATRTLYRHERTPAHISASWKGAMKLPICLAGLALFAIACGSVNESDRDDGSGADSGPGDDAGDDDGADGADDGDGGGTPPSVAAVQPVQLLESQGSGTGARLFPIVVSGDSFAAGAEIGAEPAGALVFEGPTAVSSDGTLAARLARVPVDEGAGTGTSADVAITVSQGGLSDSGTVEVVGLDELALAGGRIEVGDLAPRYSRIAVSATTTLVGDSPARLIAIGDIDVGAALFTESGSCAGGFGGLSGDSGDPGGCGTGGGRGASGFNAGGGGGGNAAVGNPGTGAGPGAGGEATGNAMLVPLGGAEGTRGNGGGGGSGGNEGGSGGRGGGILELSAGGRLAIDGEIGADGAVGADGDAASGGGGGSGGVILLRGKAGVAIGESVHAQGGAGGQGEAPTDGDGGSGSVGRIRVDAPEADLPGGIVPAPARGPMWVTDTPAIVRTESTEVTFIGGNRTYFVAVNGGDLVAAPVPGGGGQSVSSVTLVPGLNNVCVHVAEGSAAELAEARNCVAIAYVPD